MSKQHRNRVFAAAVWIVVVALLMWLVDEPVARWVKAHPLSATMFAVMNQVRWPGHFGFTVAVALLLSWKHAMRWRAGVILLSGGAISGLIVTVLKWTAGRERPARNIDGAWTFNPFRDGIVGYFNQTGLSFPSGDTALAFATAACLGIWFPKWRPVFYLWALLTAAQRVLTNSHYLSEVTAAAGIGIISVWIACTIFRQWCEPKAEARGIEAATEPS